MEVIKTAIDGVVIIEPKVFGDHRGYFFESFSERDFNSQVREVKFVQDNESKSCYGVLRGLHFQKPPYAQSKLVSGELSLTLQSTSEKAHRHSGSMLQLNLLRTITVSSLSLEDLLMGS